MYITGLILSYVYVPRPPISAGSVDSRAVIFAVNLERIMCGSARNASSLPEGKNLNHVYNLNNVLDELYELDNVLDELYDQDNVLDELYDLDNNLDKLYDLQCFVSELRI